MKQVVEISKGMFVTDDEWKNGAFISDIFDMNANKLFKPPPIHVWLVERNGQKHIFVVNDYVLNSYFGGNHQKLESELVKDGFAVHGTVSSQADLDAVKKKYPNLTAILGSDYFGI